MRANKIGVDLSLLVPKADLKPRDLGEEKFYNVDVIGEVVKDDRLIDNFKYRFDIPTDEVSADKIPLTVRRYLYPGEYKLVLKISDGNQNAEGRITETLVVPEQPDAPPPELAAARADGKAAIEKMKDEGLLPSAISILPIAKEIVTGLQRFETKRRRGHPGGRLLPERHQGHDPHEGALRRRPEPRAPSAQADHPRRRLRDRRPRVGEDEYIVNEGREVFRVRILSPEKGAKVSGPTKVVAAVAVPEGKTLQKIEFYSNETRVATLYQAPYEQTVNIKDSKSLGYVRVVGTLDDGTVAEDLRYVNAPEYVSEVTVDAVELYTTVTEKGRPVNGLQASNFKVFEDGVVQKIECFEYVKNLPLSVGVMVDTSASMLESLPGGAAGGAEVPRLHRSGRRTGPSSSPSTTSRTCSSKLTSRKDKLFRSLAGLRAEGSTALYDAIIYGLYQFTGVKGKKALVLLTDGKDTASKFDYDTLVEYVKKSGIAIYAHRAQDLGRRPRGQVQAEQDRAGHRRTDLLRRLRQEPRGRVPPDQRGPAQPVPADLLLVQHRGEGQVAQGRGQGRADEPVGEDDQRVLSVAADLERVRDFGLGPGSQICALVTTPDRAHPTSDIPSTHPRLGFAPPGRDPDRSLGIPFVAVPTDIPEEPLPGETAEAAAARLAAEKAALAAARDARVLGPRRRHARLSRRRDARKAPGRRARPRRCSAGSRAASTAS